MTGWAPLLAALIDTIVTAAGGVIIALIGGGFAFAGVLVNARHQTRPPDAISVHTEELAALRAEILDRDHRIRNLERERDYWQELALEWTPRRRRTDPQEG